MTFEVHSWSSAGGVLGFFFCAALALAAGRWTWDAILRIFNRPAAPSK